MRTLILLIMILTTALLYNLHRIEQLELRLRITEHQLERAEQRAIEAKETLAAYKYEDYRNDEDY